MGLTGPTVETGDCAGAAPDPICVENCEVFDKPVSITSTGTETGMEEGPAKTSTGTCTATLPTDGWLVDITETDDKGGGDDPMGGGIVRDFAECLGATKGKAVEEMDIVGTGTGICLGAANCLACGIPTPPTGCADPPEGALLMVRNDGGATFGAAVKLPGTAMCGADAESCPRPAPRPAIALPGGAATEWQVPRGVGPGPAAG